MPETVSDLDTLIEYFTGVESYTPSAECGRDCACTSGRCALEGGRRRRDSGSTANPLWLQIAGLRYAIAYNHQKKCIELRERATTGDARFSFTNKTPVIEVGRIFEELKPREN